MFKNNGRVVGPWDAVFSIALICCSGCGKVAPPATVSGTVQMNGHALEHCLVTFFPDGRQSSPHGSSCGVTDANGKYQLRFSNQETGVAVGSYRIILEDLNMLVPIQREPPRDTAVSAANPPATSARFNIAYSSERDTPLRCKVEPGDQQINIRLGAPTAEAVVCRPGTQP
jgi:hypothetical protein